ncbi:MAG: hypothetical protein AB1489_24800 [Acidobacteriota bacterium]
MIGNSNTGKRSGLTDRVLGGDSKLPSLPELRKALVDKLVLNQQEPTNTRRPQPRPDKK